MKRIIFALIAIMLFVVPINAKALDKNLYVVKYGDTLWDLSKSHYKDPFLWGKIWLNNAYINDPNLIFPGEVIQFTKHGITIYKKPIQAVKKPLPQKPLCRKYDSYVFYDNEKFYSDCGKGFCIWDKNAFNIGRLSYDRYNHLEVAAGAVVYIKTKKPISLKKLYVYRKLKDYLSVSICPNEPKDAYFPIGEITIQRCVKDCTYKGVITKAAVEISQKDIISAVYPYKIISSNPCRASLGKLPIELMSISSVSMTENVGYYMVFRVPKAHWQLKKRKYCQGYHIIKSPKPFVKNIVGCMVMLDRVNHNIPENTNIAKGVVVSQYKNYMTIFFSSYNSTLREIVDNTKEYVLR